MKNERSEKGSGVMKTIVPVAILVILMVVWILVDTQGDKLFADSDDPNLSFYVEETIDLDLYKSYGLPIIIEFGADYCAPCQGMKPIIEELYTELQGKAIILYADLGKYPHIGDGFPISANPTQVFYDADGNPYDPADPNHPWVTIFDWSGEHTFTTHKGTITKEELLGMLYEMGMAA